MTTHGSVRTKTEATARMYELAGEPAQPLGPGSKEKRSALEALGRVVGLDLSRAPSKIECGRLISARVDVVWGPDCYSTGDTITLVGMNRLLDAVEQPDQIRSDDAASPVLQSREVSGIDTEDRNDSSNLAAGERELERRIAEGIASLSEPTATPAGFECSGPAIGADSIQFGDGSWRSHVAEVQGWLHLSGDLDLASADAFDESLVKGLGLDDDWATGGSVPSDEVLFPRLADRLDRGLALREAFLEELESTFEGSATHSSASAHWALSWEEVQDEEENEGSGPIHAEAATWPITEFVEYANEDELNLSPSYQRADVWPTTDSQILVESILRGIPLPSIIILQQKTHGRTTYEVVDGKQRLTSILRFTGHHPRAVALIREKADQWAVPDLLQTFQRDYPRFKKLWKTHETRRLTAQFERLLYFPFPLRSGKVKPLSGELERLRGKYYCEIRNESISVLGEPRAVRYIFEQQSKYKLPVIVYEQVTSEQIHEVFSLYNKQGKHLNAEEIRNALYHQLAMMRALLVTAGDSVDVDTVAPFLRPEWGELKSTQRVLDRYGFGQAGYKRTKLLSWVSSVLLLDDGSPDRRSTANHINSLLKRVAEQSGDPLRDEATVAKAMMLLDKGLDAHAGIPPEVWARQFVNSQGKGKWQELQLVAALIGLSAAYAVHGADLDRVVEGKLGEIARASASWVRPTKTQSKEQWGFIASVVGELLEVLEAPAEHAHEALASSFGASGLLALMALRGK